MQEIQDSNNGAAASTFIGSNRYKIASGAVRRWVRRHRLAFAYMLWWFGCWWRRLLWLRHYWRLWRFRRFRWWSDADDYRFLFNLPKT